ATSAIRGARSSSRGSRITTPSSRTSCNGCAWLTSTRTLEDAGAGGRTRGLMSEFSSWFEAVAERAGRAPAHVALRDGEVALDYAEVVRRASGLAAWLYDRGVR